MRIVRSSITLEEITDDIIYFWLSAIISAILVFVFDIHHSFYQENLLPLSFIFKSTQPYFIGILGGGVLGLVWIKAFVFALQKHTYSKIKGRVRKLARSR